MKRVFGRQRRRSLGAARKTWVPALATPPVPTGVTGGGAKRMMSWMESPDSTCPPGDEISTVTGASESSASAMSRVQVARATAWLISPNSMTKRDLNARRSASVSTRSGASGFSSFTSIWMAPGRSGCNGTPRSNEASRRCPQTTRAAFRGALQRLVARINLAHIPVADEMPALPFVIYARLGAGGTVLRVRDGFPAEVIGRGRQRKARQENDCDFPHGTFLFE